MAGNTESYGDLRSVTHRRSHSIRCGVYEASDLREVTVALGDELDGGGLHEEGIIRCEDALDALLHVFHHHRLPPAVHELPHLVISRDFCLLQITRQQTALRINLVEFQYSSVSVCFIMAVILFS